MALNTPKRIKTFNTFVQSPGSDYNVDWHDSFDDEASVNKSASATINRSDATTNSSIGISNGNGSLSPVSSCDSPEFSLRNNSNTSSNVSANSAYNALNGSDGRENRRGRPRSEALTTLMIEGSTSPSSIKCSYCHRVFPREKSLQAHLRTHTGERPYQCDYPGCTRAFTQSGQLKTHQRLHTGERPFMCSAPKCQMRFTHANRHCPEHPYDQLKRCDDFVIQAVTEQNYDVIKWLEKYKMEKEDRTPTRKTPKRTKTSLSDDPSMRMSHSSEKSNENFNIAQHGSDENKFPVTPSNPYKSRKGLMVELDMNAGLGASPITGNKMKPTPKLIHWQEPLSQEEDSADEFETPAQSTFNPKKRWLREAWQNDLAKPLEPLSNGQYNVLDGKKSISYQMLSPSKPQYLSAQSKQQSNMPNQQQMNPNQMRPTVLMVASKDRAMPLVSPPTNEQSTNGQYSSTTTSKQSLIANQYARNFSPHTPHQQQYMHKPMNTVEQQTSIASSPNIQLKYFDSQLNQQLEQQQTQQQQQQQHPVNDTSDIQTERHIVIASTPIAASSDNSSSSSGSTDGKNRKWLGALALMELATDENNPVSSTFPLVYENPTTN